MRGKSPPPRGSEGHPTHTVNRLNSKSRTGRLLVQERFLVQGRSAGILNQKLETTKKAAGKDKVVSPVEGESAAPPSYSRRSRLYGFFSGLYVHFMSP